MFAVEKKEIPDGTFKFAIQTTHLPFASPRGLSFLPRAVTFYLAELSNHAAHWDLLFNVSPFTDASPAPYDLGEARDYHGNT